MKLNLMFIVLILIIFSLLYSEIIWEVNYGLMGYDECYVKPSFLISSDGGYIILYTSVWYDPYSGAIIDDKLTKFDSIGNNLWTSSGLSFLRGIFEAEEGYYIFTRSVSDTFIKKIDFDGNQLWVEIIDDHNVTCSIDQDETGLYICGRSITSHCANIMKLDFDANIIWTYDFAEGNSFISGVKTIDNCFVLKMCVYDPNGVYYDLVKVDATGNLLWTYHPNSLYIDPSIVELSDNTIILSTNEQIIKLDLNGNLINSIDASFFYAIDLINENCFLAASRLGNIYKLDKYDYALNHIQEISDFPKFYFKQLNDNGFIFYQKDLIHLIRTDENLVSTNNHLIQNDSISLSNYPNPFNPTTIIEFSIQKEAKVDLVIFSITGQKIKTLVHNEFIKGVHSIIWNGDDESGKLVSSGIYYYKLNINGKTKVVKKCLLLK